MKPRKEQRPSLVICAPHHVNSAPRTLTKQRRLIAGEKAIVHKDKRHIAEANLLSSEWIHTKAQRKRREECPVRDRHWLIEWSFSTSLREGCLKADTIKSYDKSIWQLSLRYSNYCTFHYGKHQCTALQHARRMCTVTKVIQSPTEKVLWVVCMQCFYFVTRSA